MCHRRGLFFRLWRPILALKFRWALPTYRYTPGRNQNMPRAPTRRHSRRWRWNKAM